MFPLTLEEARSMVDFRTPHGAALAIPSERLDVLRAALRGTLILPGETGYDAARALWNGWKAIRLHGRCRRSSA